MRIILEEQGPDILLKKRGNNNLRLTYFEN